VSGQELERCPTQALAFGVSDEGSERPAVGGAWDDAGSPSRETVADSHSWVGGVDGSTLVSGAIRASPG
jgi:hypothetical protein